MDGEDRAADAGADAGPVLDEDARGWAQSLLVALAIALMGGSVGMRFITGARLDQTAVLFIVLPAILALAVARSKPAQTTTGLIFRTTLIVLLFASILFGETLICILVASPLVFIVAAAIGVPIDRRRRAKAAGRSPVKYTAVVALVFVAGLEGAVPILDVPRDSSVTVSRFVDATPAEVERALASQPQFDRPRPALLQIGFPRPVDAWGSGLQVGDQRTIAIVGDGHYGTTATGHLVMAVTHRTATSVQFTTVQDTSRVADWLTWQKSEVTWGPADGGTVVTWTVHYERRLAPFWYFDPVQRGAVHLSAGYLIDAVATPRG